MALKGRERILARLQAIPKTIRAEVRPAIEKGAQKINDAQRALVPKDSGALAASIGYSMGGYAAENSNVRGFASQAGGDPDLTAVLHAGNAEAFYAAFVEFGTSGHPQGGMYEGTEHKGTVPQPFFYPGYRASKRAVRASVSRAFKKGIAASK